MPCHTGRHHPWQTLPPARPPAADGAHGRCVDLPVHPVHLCCLTLPCSCTFGARVRPLEREGGRERERERVSRERERVSSTTWAPSGLPSTPSLPRRRNHVFTCAIWASLRGRRRANWGATLSRNSQRRLGVPASARAGHRAAFRAFGRQTGTNIFSRGAVCFRRAGPKSKNACKGSHPTDQPG